LKALYDAKQLATPADYGAAWGEIATGLEAAQ
jgi:hypothetical protein